MTWLALKDSLSAGDYVLLTMSVVVVVLTALAIAFDRPRK